MVGQKTINNSIIVKSVRKQTNKTLGQVFTTLKLSTTKKKISTYKK